MTNKDDTFTAVNTVVDDGKDTQVIALKADGFIARMRNRHNLNRKFSPISRHFISVKRVAKNPVMLGVWLLVVGLATSAGIIQAQQAQAAQNAVMNSVLSTVQDTETSTPDTLLEDNGARDEARIKEAEDVASDPSMRCAPKSGANSLLGVLVDDSAQVFMPLQRGAYRNTSAFGRRYSPFYSFHKGHDMSAPLGTPVYSVAAGKVIAIAPRQTATTNNAVVIEHRIGNHTFTSWYLHMYSKDIMVSVGQTVEAGQQIGRVGSKGWSTGPHLHLEIHPGAGLNSNAIEPMSYLRERGAIFLSQRCN